MTFPAHLSFSLSRCSTCLWETLWLFSPDGVSELFHTLFCSSSLFHIPWLSLPTDWIDWRIFQHLPPAQLNKSFCMLLSPFRALHFIMITIAWIAHPSFITCHTCICFSVQFLRNLHGQMWCLFVYVHQFQGIKENQSCLFYENRKFACFILCYLRISPLLTVLHLTSVNSFVQCPFHCLHESSILSALLLYTLLLLSMNVGMFIPAGTTFFLQWIQWIQLPFCTFHSLVQSGEARCCVAVLIPEKTECCPECAWCFTVWRLIHLECTSILVSTSPEKSIKCSLVHSSFILHYRTVVKCNIAKSQALYSAQRGLKTNNAAVFKVGAIIINIPQHPATLHSMMVRSSHQLSKQISDLIRQPSNTCVCFIYPYSIIQTISFTFVMALLRAVSLKLWISELKIQISKLTKLRLHCWGHWSSLTYC